MEDFDMRSLEAIGGFLIVFDFSRRELYALSRFIEYYFDVFFEFAPYLEMVVSFIPDF
jgi:hypothetical protein